MPEGLTQVIATEGLMFNFLAHSLLVSIAICRKVFNSSSKPFFLPFADHSYRQAPYQDCSKQEYETLLKKMPEDIDWAKLSEYEEKDMTHGSQELACSAEGGCEIVDLVAV